MADWSCCRPVGVSITPCLRLGCPEVMVIFSERSGMPTLTPDFREDNRVVPILSGFTQSWELTTLDAELPTSGGLWLTVRVNP